jgi:predicted RNA binding protein YcfA (HicA-like mRNA interferase family)
MKYLVVGLFFYTFVVLFNSIAMKRYKVKDIIDMLHDDGWYIETTRGSHRQFKHPIKSGRVTLRGKPSDTPSQFELNSIFKQAGWK